MENAAVSKGFHDPCGPNGIFVASFGTLDVGSELCLQLAGRRTTGFIFAADHVTAMRLFNGISFVALSCLSCAPSKGRWRQPAYGFLLCHPSLRGRFLRCPFCSGSPRSSRPCRNCASTFSSSSSFLP